MEVLRGVDCIQEQTVLICKSVMLEVKKKIVNSVFSCDYPVQTRNIYCLSADVNKGSTDQVCSLQYAVRL